jgi:hypothetical protein
LSEDGVHPTLPQEWKTSRKSGEKKEDSRQSPLDAKTLHKIREGRKKLADNKKQCLQYESEMAGPRIGKDKATTSLNEDEKAIKKRDDDAALIAKATLTNKEQVGYTQ